MHVQRRGEVVRKGDKREGKHNMLTSNHHQTPHAHTHTHTHIHIHTRADTEKDRQWWRQIHRGREKEIDRE